MSESAELLTQIDADRGHDPLEDACLERPKMREFNILFCHIALEDHTFEEIRDAETSICGHVKRILTTPLWELSFGGPKSDRMHKRVGNGPQQQRTGFAG